METVRNVVVFLVENNIWNKQYKNASGINVCLADMPSFITKTVLRAVFKSCARAAKIKQIASQLTKFLILKVDKHEINRKRLVSIVAELKCDIYTTKGMTASKR